MRFVIAIVLFVAAVVTAGIGVAQRTIWQGPDHVTSAVQIEGGVPFVVVDGAVLNSNAGSQNIEISGGSSTFMAYGRTSDVMGWVGDAPAAVVALDEETNEAVVQNKRGTETESPSPAGSDLWLAEFTAEGDLNRRINVPADVSLLIAADGTEPAPSSFSVTWPLDNSTPWAGPLIITGIGLLLLGLIMLMWALIHARRKHGPRRKTPKMPKPPKPAQLKPAPRRPAITMGKGRRPFVALPVVLVGALALTGCTAGAPTASPSPDPSASAEVPEFEPPVATTSQIERIVSRVAEAVVAADAARDEALAATRLAGPALEARVANYKAIAADGEIAPVQAFPTGEVELMVPQQLHVWPRIVFASVAGEENDDYGIVLVQESPRDQYKVHYLVRLTQSIPEMAPADLGAASLAADNKLLAFTPGDLAAQYGDVLINGDASAFLDVFDPENDLVRERLGAPMKETRRAETPTATFDYVSEPGTSAPYAMTTLDTGAIVAVDIRESETVKPKETGAAINPKGTVKALSGKSTTTKGFTSVYAIQVLFYVPPITADDQKVRVLGFATNIVSAAEVP